MNASEPGSDWRNPLPLVVTSRAACAFCGSTDTRLTIEHVWPQWISRSLRGRGELKARRADSEWRTKKIDTKVRAVCATCNGGWMSDIEAETMPILEPMILGDIPRVLSPLDQVKLARWAYKTALVFDLVNTTRCVPSAEFATFYEKRRITEQAQVLLGAYNGRFITHGRTEPLHPTVKGELLPRVVHGFWSSLSIGHAVFLIARFGVRRPVPVENPDYYAQATHRIWPPSGRPIPWPGYRDVLTDEQVHEYCAQLIYAGSDSGT